MESTGSRTVRSWYVTISRLLKRGTSTPNGVWLGRFRYLTIYTVLKGSLLLAVGVLSMRLGSSRSWSTLHLAPNYWIIVLLGTMICTLLLISGLVMASENRPRFIGLVLLGASDLCVLSAVIYAALLSDLDLLLIILVFISCTSLFFIERIARYARSFRKSNSELENMKNETDMLLLQLNQNLIQAIERERMSLKREMHDGLLQELSALSLQMNVMIRRKSEDGALQLNAADVKKLETLLRRAVKETRNVMADIQNTKAAFETIDTVQMPVVVP